MSEGCSGSGSGTGTKQNWVLCAMSKVLFRSRMRSLCESGEGCVYRGMAWWATKW